MTKYINERKEMNIFILSNIVFASKLTSSTLKVIIFIINTSTNGTSVIVFQPMLYAARMKQVITRWKNLTRLPCDETLQTYDTITTKWTELVLILSIDHNLWQFHPKSLRIWLQSFPTMTYLIQRILIIQKRLNYQSYSSIFNVILKCFKKNIWYNFAWF